MKINRGVPFFFTLPIIFNGFYPAASLAGGDVSLSNPLSIIAREDSELDLKAINLKLEAKETARLALADSLTRRQQDKEALSAQNAELSQALMDLKKQTMDKDDVVESLMRNPSDAQSLNEEPEKQLALLNQKMAEQQQCNLQVESNQNQATEMARLALADSLARSQHDKEQLSVEVAELSQQLLGFKEQISDRDKYIEHLKSNLNDALAGKKAAEKLNDSLTKDHDDAMQQLAKASPLSSPKPVTQSEMRDYALGVYWAQEIENIIHQKSQDGDDIDPIRVLSGVADMIHNSVKVPQETLREILAELYGNNGNDREKENGKVSDTTLNRRLFDGKANIQHSKFGYDYQIKKKGNGKINEDDEVAIVIRESLANGKVINDMIKKGTVISQRLNKLPPLFSTAIALLGNHGELRMVVPPQLAYGEKGHAPEIPPDSTMVYDIIVANVRTVGQR